jgi:hypothetical protein
MTAIEDPRIRFYLENRALIEEWAGIPDKFEDDTDPRYIFWDERQDQIQEWAAVRPDAALAVADLLYPVLEDAVDAMSEAGADTAWVHGAHHRPAGWPMARAANNSWGAECAIGIEFRAAGVTLWGRSRPTLGLRVESGDIDPTVRDTLISVLNGVVGHRPQGKFWLVRQTLDVQADRWWDDFGPVRDQILREVTEGWREVAPIVDRAFEGE